MTENKVNKMLSLPTYAKLPTTSIREDKEKISIATWCKRNERNKTENFVFPKKSNGNIRVKKSVENYTSSSASKRICEISSYSRDENIYNDYSNRDKKKVLTHSSKVSI